MKRQASAHSRRNPLLIAFFIAFTLNAVVVLWMMAVSAEEPVVQLSQATPSPVRTVCPGDTLNYTFTLSVSRESTLDLESVIVSLDSERRGGQVLLERLTISDPATLTLAREWPVPLRYLDIALGDLPWRPGRYERLIQVRQTGSRQVEDEIAVPFEIGKDCPPLWN